MPTFRIFEEYTGAFQPPDDLDLADFVTGESGITQSQLEALQDLLMGESAPVGPVEEGLKAVRIPDDPDDRCSEAVNGQHDPDWTTVATESDGDETYIDVNCRLCGRSGSIGTQHTLEAGITW